MHFIQEVDYLIIINMLTSIHMWKDSFIKVCPERGFSSFYMNNNYEPLYPLKWSKLIRQMDWDFKNLSLDD